METLHMLHPLDVAVGDTASTVRLGTKWYDAVRIGDHVKLCTCRSDDPFGPDQKEKHVVRGRGRVVSLWGGRLADVPARLLVFEHEERSRQYWGLLDSMRKAYGGDLSENSIVTVLVYDRVE